MSDRWWRRKIRQFRSHVMARVGPREREAVARLLTPAQLALFDAMPVADRRHGLDVVADLRNEGVSDADVLIAGLLHDCGKGLRVGLWPRVAWSLGEAYGPVVPYMARRLPGFAVALDRLRDHVILSADLAAHAGCSPRTVELIRHQDDPLDETGKILRLADEAN